MCGACERERASTMVQMYGQPYNQNTLKPVPPGETASLHRVSINKSNVFHSIDLQEGSTNNIILFRYDSELLGLQKMQSISGIISSVTSPKTSHVLELC